MTDFEERRPGEIPTLDTRAEAEQAVDKRKRYQQILDVMADYEALYAGNDIQLKYYEHLAVSAENMVTGEGVR